MAEESAWQTFSQIKKQEEKKLSNSKINFDIYRDASRQYNDIRVYDTDTTDSDDLEFYRRELNKNETIPPIDTSFITPPKSNFDSVHSSPSDNGISGKGEEDFTSKLNERVTTENDFVNKRNNLFNTNKEAIIKQKSKENHKKNGMESAWTKFIKDNPTAVGNKIRERDNEYSQFYFNNAIYKMLSCDEDNFESIDILENLSVNSINSLTSIASLNSSGSRKNGFNTIEDYAFFTNSNKDLSAWKNKDNSKSSMKLLNSDNRSHSRIQKSFLESDISAWRNRPFKEIEESQPRPENSVSSNNDANNVSTDSSKSQQYRTYEFDNRVTDSISAWKLESSKSIKEILKGYNIKQAIGKGYCGTIFKGINEKTGQPIAVKAEKITEKNKHLAEEYAIYQRLYGLEGMPKVLYYGRLEKDNIMIMELLGPSIEALFRLCQRQFTMKTICMIGKQLLTRLEKVHERGIVYRDIKPENFLIGYINYSKPITNKYKEGEEVYLQDGSVGRPPVATVYLADFGLSEFYKNPVTNHYVPNKKKPPCGTPRYMSLNTHRCDQQTPRDDLEALCYCLMYLCFRGRLPWMGITAKTPEAMIMSIGRTKASISVDQLCKSLPTQFKYYLKYVRGLGFHDKPDYNFLRNLFDQILSDMGQEDDGDFDWIAPIRLHQEQKAKKQKMEREKEMKRVEMEKKKRETHEKKRKLSISQDSYQRSGSDHSTRSIDGPCKKQTVTSPRTAEIEVLYNKKRIHQTTAGTVTSQVNVTAIPAPSHTSSFTSTLNPNSNSGVNPNCSTTSSNSSSTTSTISNNSIPIHGINQFSKNNSISNCYGVQSNQQAVNDTNYPKNRLWSQIFAQKDQQNV